MATSNRFAYLFTSVTRVERARSWNSELVKGSLFQVKSGVGRKVAESCKVFVWLIFCPL